MTNLRVEIGTKPSTTALEALLRLKMDRKACEQLFAELFQSRQALDDKVEGLDQEVQGLTFQLQGLHNSRAAAGTAISSRGRPHREPLDTSHHHHQQQQLLAAEEEG